MRRSDETDPINYEPGEYGRWRGVWFARCPTMGPANFEGDTLGPIVLANLSKHTVTEHEDGTITVSPSILVGGRTRELYHGYLERGVWRSC